jgi:tRNA A37 methylthiotransferase MiaB
MKQTFFIKTFGCQQNVADSQRIASYYLARGYKPGKTIKSAVCLTMQVLITISPADFIVFPGL